MNSIASDRNLPSLNDDVINKIVSYLPPRQTVRFSLSTNNFSKKTTHILPVFEKLFGKIKEGESQDLKMMKSLIG